MWPCVFSTVNSLKIHQRSCTDKEEIENRFGILGLSIMYVPCPPPHVHMCINCMYWPLFSVICIYTRCALTISLIFISPTLQWTNTFAMIWKNQNHIVSTNQNPLGDFAFISSRSNTHTLVLVLRLLIILFSLTLQWIN